MRNAPYVPGTPNPFHWMVKTPNTRFHVGRWVSPVFSGKTISRPYDNFTRSYNMDREVPQPTLSGLGATVGDGRLWDEGDGVFNRGGYGGGVFDGNISGLGSLAAAPRRSLGSLASLFGGDGMEWKVKSDATVAAQSTLNAHLLGMGMCPIAVDGKLGGATCGAAQYVNDNKGAGTFAAPSACADHKSEWVSPKKNTGGCGGGTPAPITTPVLTPGTQLESGMSSSTKRALGFALGGVLAIGAVMVLRKKR